MLEVAKAIIFLLL